MQITPLGHGHPLATLHQGGPLVRPVIPWPIKCGRCWPMELAERDRGGGI